MTRDVFSPVPDDRHDKAARTRAATRARHLPRRRGHRGFTIIELLTVVSIIALLVGLVTVAVKQAVASSRRSECASNMRQCGAAIAMFQGHRINNFALPQFGSAVWQGWWVEQCKPYYGDPAVLLCPEDMGPLPTSVAVAENLRISDESCPWFDPTGRYAAPQDWQVLAVSFRGPEPFHRPGGLGPKMNELAAPGKTVLLDEAWEGKVHGGRVSSLPSDVWQGYDRNNPDPAALLPNMNSALGRHLNTSNFLLADFSVKAVDIGSGPFTVSHYVDGWTY